MITDYRETYVIEAREDQADKKTRISEFYFELYGTVLKS